MQASSYVVGHNQKDGRRFVIERHTDDAGLEHVVEYGPTDSVDYQTTLLARAAQLDEYLADHEFAACVEDGTVRIQYQTAAQFAARFRQKYRAASREEAARLATWIIDRITAAQLTDLQVRTAFGLTTTQYSAMKTRWTTLRTHWLAVQAAAGE